MVGSWVVTAWLARRRGRRGLATAVWWMEGGLRGLPRGGKLVLVQEEPAVSGDAQHVRDLAVAVAFGQDEDDRAREVAGLDDEGLGLGHDGLAEGGWATGTAALGPPLGSAVAVSLVLLHLSPTRTRVHPLSPTALRRQARLVTLAAAVSAVSFFFGATPGFTCDRNGHP